MTSKPISKKMLMSIVSILIGLALIINPLLSQFAMAAEGAGGEGGKNPAEAKAAIEVSGISEDTKGTIYKVIDVSWNDDVNQPEHPQYIWNDKVAKWVKTNYNKFIEEEDNVVTDQFTDQISDGNEPPEGVPSAASFYDKLSSAIKKGEVSLDAVATIVGDSDGKATSEKLDKGSYLILFNNDMRVYRPSVVNVYPESKKDGWKFKDSYSVVVKSSEVPFEKSVNKNHFAMGDTAEFTVNAVLPVYPKNATAKQFVITDTLPEGLDLIKDTIKVVGKKAGNAEGALETLEADNHYVLTSEGNNFKIDFNYDKLVDMEEVKITYKAKVNDKVKIHPEKNINKATVTYSNDPYDDNSTNTKESAKEIYTYGIDVTSTTGEKPLPGTEFELKDKDGNPVKLIEIEPGKYRKPLTPEEEEKAVTKLKVDKDGKLRIVGLDLDDYKLKEVKVPHGFTNFGKDKDITISDNNGDGKVEVKPVEGEEGITELAVNHRKSFLIPATGGSGTMIYAAFGTMIIAAGICGIIISRKKSCK